MEPRKRKPKSKNYFTADTEAAIIRFNQEPDSEIRSRIYREELHHAFFKLTQNLIHTFRFYYTEESNLEDLQHEVITFILSKLHLFDPSKGAKAYSYFGTIAKRYLIASNEKNYKKRMQLLSLDSISIEEDSDWSNTELPDLSVEDSTNTHHVDELSEFIDEYVDFCTENIFKLFPRPEDAQIADAILELFRKRENISIFNKKALYIYIREIIDVKTPKITKVANDLGDLYKKHYVHFLEYGYTDFRI
jgi:DNA-directed RNA polymerase specialized sigma24 family protein